MVTKKKAKKELLVEERVKAAIIKEILEQVRGLSSGKIPTAYPLVQLGKELIEAERVEASDF